MLIATLYFSPPNACIKSKQDALIKQTSKYSNRVIKATASHNICPLTVFTLDLLCLSTKCGLKSYLGASKISKIFWKKFSDASLTTSEWENSDVSREDWPKETATRLCAMHGVHLVRG